MNYLILFVSQNVSVLYSYTFNSTLQINSYTKKWFTCKVEDTAFAGRPLSTTARVYHNLRRIFLQQQ